ncbi:MAG TPA: hypothetical protein VIU41_09045 [Geobacteraceae bacterium]
MILNPGILALVVASLLVCGMVLYAAIGGVRILRHWDITSGSESQLELERTTYLISTILAYFLALQLVSLFLFVQTADSICTLFVGAMCAVGSLTVNGYGYPTLLLKVVTFFLAGLWLVLNHADSRGYDYPLIRPKYTLLLLITPLIVAETVVQGLYFGGLRPDIITSCCGSLFSPASRGLAQELAAAPAKPLLVAFYSAVAAVVSTSLYFFRRQRGGYLVALASGGAFLVSLVAIISVISLYVYQMPSHHCPFCILQKEYGYIGYLYYGCLLAGSVAGLGVGVLMPFRRHESLSAYIPRIQRRLALVAAASYMLLGLAASWPIFFSPFRLDG